MTPNYEPSAEQVEALERDIRRLTGAPYNLGQTMSVAILRRQHEREAAAKLALRYLAELGGGNSEGNIYARRALERWDQLDAPKVPTLADAVEQIERECPGRVIATLKDSQAWTIIKLAAVERAEAK